MTRRAPFRSRAAWPWGRTPPARKIREIDGLIEAEKRRLRIIEDKLASERERSRLKLEAFESERRVAESCLRMEVYEKNKLLAYELLDYGEDFFNLIEESEDQDEVRKRLDERLSSFREKESKTGQPGDSKRVGDNAPDRDEEDDMRDLGSVTDKSI